MIRINLLPVLEIRARKKELLKLLSCTFGLVLLGLILLVTYLVQGISLADYRNKNQTLRRQLLPYRHLQAEMKRLTLQREALQRKIDIIRRLEQERDWPTLLLATLSRTFPRNKLWITSLREKDSQLTLEGISLSQEAIAEFIQRLEGSGVVRQVDLSRSVQDHYQNLKIYKFILFGQIQIGPGKREG